MLGQIPLCPCGHPSTGALFPPTSLICYNGADKVLRCQGCLCSSPATRCARPLDRCNRHFGRSPSSLSNIFLFVVDHVHDKYKEILFLDRERIAPQLARFSRAVANKGGEVYNVWGFVDGTVRACLRPTNGTMQRSVYNAHKRKRALKFQTLVTPDGIAHVFGPVEGRRHDLTILRRSNLEAVLRSDKRFDGYIIYGYPAYGKSAHFASPFGGRNINVAQKYVNKSMSNVRVSVEWSYSQIVRYWSHLDHRTKMCLGTSPISKLYKVAILLTN
ncbi:hypothetical protein H257_03946, partial [Aphanomyces astaci]